MWEYAKEQITREIGAVSDLGQKKKLLLHIFFRSAPKSEVPSQIPLMSG
jgi:hypothetical protein